MTPYVSIIMPTYNQQEYIVQAIESVLKQTFEDWELLVVDDGSDDGTTDLVASRADRRIGLIKMPHRGLEGLSDSYNTALDRAQGHYIAILDGDDTWPSYKLEKQIGMFDTGILLTWGKASVIDSTGKLTGDVVIQKCKYPSPGESTVSQRSHILREMLLHNIVAPSTAMISRTALYSIGGFLQPIRCPFVDYPTWLALLRVGCGRESDEILGHWRHHDRQTTQEHALLVRQAATQIADEILSSMSPEEQVALGLDRAAMIQHRAYHLADTYWSLALSAMKDQRFLESQRYLREAMLLGHWSLRAKAPIALVALLIKKVSVCEHV